jgi:hypothetical protein
MGTNWRNCYKCGQKIILARMPQGHWLAMEPDGSGRHYCRSGADWSYRTTSAHPTVNAHEISRPSRSWKLETLGRPLTYSTTCWWCGEAVFFHTNGNGDCVLFDSLGWPWEVHPCWEEHRNTESRHDKVAGFEDILQDGGYDGVRIRPSQLSIQPPEHEESRFIFVNGYVAWNPTALDNLETVKLSLDDEPGEWVRVDVATAGGRLFPFYLPVDVAKLVHEYSIVRVAGRWSYRDSTWLLLTTRIDWLQYPDGLRISRRVTRIGRRARCRFCGCQLYGDAHWGINRAFTVECSECSQFRNGRDPISFEAFCSRLLKARRPKRSKPD